MLMATAWSGHAQTAFDNVQTGSRSDANVNRRELAGLMDSLQNVLQLTPIDCAPIAVSGDRSIQRFDRAAFDASLREMQEKLGLTFEIPTRINASSLAPLLLLVLEAASEQPPVVQSQVATQVAQLAATLNGIIVEDGRVALDHWGFKMGTDSTLSDSILVPFGDYQGFLDTSIADTGAFSFDKTGLTRYTTYYFSAWGSNSKGVGYGDTLSFTTLPDLPAGFNLDTLSVTSNMARVEVVIDDVGGQGPDSAKFFWDTVDFVGLDVAGDSLAADSTWNFSDPNQVGFATTLSGLTRYTDYYYRAYATNLAGRAEASANASFRTKPEAPSLTANWNADSLKLSGRLTDLGGDNGLPLPSAVGILWGTDAQLTGATSLTATYVAADSTFDATIAAGLLAPGEVYHGAGFATNAGGTSYSDTISFATLVGTTTSSDVTAVGDSITLRASFDFGAASPTQVGFKWGQSADLASASDTVVSLQPDSTTMLTIARPSSALYFSAFGTNSEGTSSGDTLKIDVPSVLTNLPSGVAAGTGTLNGEVAENGGLSLSAAGFKWGLRSDLSDALDTVVTLGADNSLTAVLASLQEDSTYYYSAFATNAMGTSYGDTISFTASHPCDNETSVTYQGYDYSLIAIGGQCWFAENLRNVNYNDGSAIGTTWSQGNIGQVTAYGEESGDGTSNVVTYGRLYNWPAATDERGLCPSGWHLPSMGEFEELWNELGGRTSAGTKMKTAEWYGDNSSGFAALPGGFRQGGGARSSSSLGTHAWFWSTAPSPSFAWQAVACGLSDASAAASITVTDKINGYSVRCLRDRPTLPIVTTMDASNLEDTAATLRGKVPVNLEPITSAGFKWGLQSDLSDAQDVAGDTLAGEFRANLIGLTKNSTYYFVAYATNALGTTHGDTLEFVAKKLKPCEVGTIEYQGYQYKVVTINNQCWFAENLRSENYNDGINSPINSGLNNADWSNATVGAVTVYEEGTTNASTYLNQFGRLYNGYAVETGLLCPTGWHIPTLNEWTALANLTGATGLKAMGNDSPSWNGSNSYKFRALPSGFRVGTPVNSLEEGFGAGSFNNLGSATDFWSSTFDGANVRTLALTNTSGVGFYARPRSHGHPVRCVEDAIVSTSYASAIERGQGQVNGIVNEDEVESIVAAGFKWGLQSDLASSNDTTVVIGSGGTFGALLTGLAPGTKYYYRAYVTNADATVLGIIMSFETPCEDSPPTGCDSGALNQLTYQGYDYRLVEIGGKCWFAENLRSENYRDGSAIPGNLNSSAWSDASNGATAIFDEGGSDDASKVAAYGRLYNWFAATDGRGLCPSGWHVPSTEEFESLEAAFGMTDFTGSWRGTTEGLKMKSATCWDGSNDLGFAAVPAGKRGSSGYFDGDGTDFGSAYFWTSTSSGASTAWIRQLNAGTASGVGGSGVFIGPKPMNEGYSIRCLQNSEAETLPASNFGTTEARIHGRVNRDGGLSLSETGFEWSDQPGLSNATTVPVAMEADSTFSVVVTGLATNTSYYYRAFATIGGTTLYGEILEFSTLCDQFPSSLQGCDSGTLTQLAYQGYDYQLVEINGKCWFAENLQSEYYLNGDEIPSDLDDATWGSTTAGAVTVYLENRPEEAFNLAQFGRLYNGYAVTDARELCPAGWHVPTSDEFTALTDYLGGASFAGEALKSASCSNGTNSTGFSSIAGGSRSNTGYFGFQYINSHFWLSTPSGAELSARKIEHGYAQVYATPYELSHGFSVRCIRSPKPEVSTLSASNIGIGRGDLNGEVTDDGGSALTAIGFKWGLQPDLSDATTSQGAMASGNTFEVTLNSLAASSTYYFCAFATNIAGTTYGDTLTFETPCDPMSTNMQGCDSGSLTQFAYQGYDYQLIDINGECWFAENLRSEKYNDGTVIPSGLDNSTWETTSTGALATYEEGSGNEALNRAAYGHLYNWYAVNDSRGLCPTGWHVPSDVEFSALSNFLGAGTAGEAMKSSSCWDGSNVSGYSALAAGARTTQGYFNYAGAFGYFWSSTSDGTNAWFRFLESSQTDLGRQSLEPHYGQSIRCVRD